ncbi:MAG: hypothetical protein IT477_10335 [Rhodanobacteraceae bacterium]|nr:hypothetical protein [Rhodanobacteraceae bacterium]
MQLAFTAYPTVRLWSLEHPLWWRTLEPFRDDDRAYRHELRHLALSLHAMGTTVRTEANSQPAVSVLSGVLHRHAEEIFLVSRVLDKLSSLSWPSSPPSP